MNKHAQAMGRITSKTKAEAARLNGAKGGRPAKCPKCRQQGKFIRLRHFSHHTTARVWMCENAACENVSLYFHTGSACRPSGRK